MRNAYRAPLTKMSLKVFVLNLLANSSENLQIARHAVLRNSGLKFYSPRSFFGSDRVATLGPRWKKLYHGEPREGRNLGPLNGGGRALSLYSRPNRRT